MKDKKRNSDGVLSFVKNSFKKVIASAQPCKTTKSRRMVSFFFQLKKNVPRRLPAQAIAFFTTELLSDSENISRTESNAARYQRMRYKVSTSFAERMKYAR